MTASRIFGSPPPRSHHLRRRWRRVRWAALGAVLAAASAGGVYGLCRWALPPEVWIWIGFGGLAVVGVALLGWWQTHPGRHVVTGSILLGMMAGAALYAFKAPARLAGPMDPNRQTAERIVRLKQALERRGDYKSSHASEDFYPPNKDFIAFVLSQPQGKTLVASPWGGVAQFQRVAPGRATGLPTAAERQVGYPAPALGAPIGPGRAPLPGQFTAFTYGALVYDRDDRTGRYVLYGIGQRDGSAVLVGLAEGEP